MAILLGKSRSLSELDTTSLLRMKVDADIFKVDLICFPSMRQNGITKLDIRSVVLGKLKSTLVFKRRTVHDRILYVTGMWTTHIGTLETMLIP
jgi:hypothetical protein